MNTADMTRPERWDEIKRMQSAIFMTDKRSGWSRLMKRSLTGADFFAGHSIGAPVNMPAVMVNAPMDVCAIDAANTEAQSGSANLIGNSHGKLGGPLRHGRR